MAAYYNEWEPYCAQWLRNLIAAGHLPAGDVDTRSITEVMADDLRGYTQCHFFAGIGGWPLALRMALWPDDRPVWTGSCPCQPFSNSGNKAAQSDERHLWPHWFGLIAESKPPIIFGEQVATAVAAGWLDDALNDLEAEDYAGAAAVLPACSVKSPHTRDRLWFVAHSNSSGEFRLPAKEGIAPAESKAEVGQEDRERVWLLNIGDSPLENAERTGQQESRGCEIRRAPAKNREADNAFYASEASDYTWLEGPDGRYRPTKPGIRLLVNGFPNRLACLTAGGNAIQIQTAAQFIHAADEAMRSA